MVAETIRQWSEEGDGIVVHTLPTMHSPHNTITGNRRRIAPVPLILKDNRWRCDMERLEAALAEPKNTLLLLCSPHNPTGKSGVARELETMAAPVSKKHGVRVISDEIHYGHDLGRTPPLSQGARSLMDHGRCSPPVRRASIFRPLPGPTALSRRERARQLPAGAKGSRRALFPLPCRRWSPHIAAYRDGAPGSMPCTRHTCRRDMRCVADTLNNAFPALCWQRAGGHLPAWIEPAPAQR